MSVRSRDLTGGIPWRCKSTRIRRREFILVELESSGQTTTNYKNRSTEGSKTKCNQRPVYHKTSGQTRQKRGPTAFASTSPAGPLKTITTELMSLETSSTGTWRHHPLVLEAHDSRLRVSLISSERLPFPDTCHGFTIRPRYCFPTRVFGTLFVHDGLVLQLRPPYPHPGPANASLPFQVAPGSDRTFLLSIAGHP
jgi:hypothetical protein